MRNILKENTAEQWDKVRTQPEYAKRVDEVRQVAEESLHEPVPLLPYTKFKLFYETGNRSVYETPYFERRKRLNAYSLMAKLTGEKKYIDALEDIIWHICDEYTWALPAHFGTEKEIADQKIFLDLFACETGFALAECYSLLEDTLSDLVKRRMRVELRTRIIDSFLQRKQPYFWETVENNWAAVCGGSVLAVFLYCAEDDEIAAALPQLESAFTYFLKSFTEDGCCLEGYNYWNYGFGFFVMAADLLRNFTQGKTDYFKKENVKTVAHYQQKAILRAPSMSVSFADGSNCFRPLYGLSYYLKQEYPDLYLPEKFAPALSDHCYRWGHFIRAFLWTSELAETNSTLPQTDVLEKAGWYIRRKENYTLAAKAGHNAEPHNHNDIGSFIFCTDKGQTLCDFGAGEYVKDYFSDKRYEFLVNRSLGHSVPYVNGKEQAAGAEYRGELLFADENQAVMEIGGAYPDSTLRSLRRCFQVEEDGVILRDEFEFSEPPTEVVERFVTHEEPCLQAGEGMVGIGDCVIEFSPQLYDVRVTKEMYSNHAGDATAAYMVDVQAKKLEQSMTWEYKIRKVNETCQSMN